MKVSELIGRAQNVMKAAGDVEVVMLTDTPDGMFAVVDKVGVDLIEYPVDEYTNQNSAPVLAIAWKECFNEDDGDNNELPHVPFLRVFDGGR